MIQVDSHDTHQGSRTFSPDKVIAAMGETFHDVCLIILGTDHDDRHNSIWDCLAELQAELMACICSAVAELQPIKIKQQKQQLRLLEGLRCCRGV